MRYQPSARERLVALAAVVALHEERAAEPQLADLAGVAHSAPVSGSTIFASKPGHRPAERPAPVLGLVALVVAREADAAGLGHAEHVVAQLGIGRPHRGGHDRPEVAAPDRAEVAARERRVLRRGARPTPRTRSPSSAAPVRAGRASPPGRWRSSTRAWRRRAACRAGRRRSRRSRRTASSRTAPRRRCSGAAR